MMEKWKDVVGFEELYSISNTGKVKSKNYARRGYEKILTPKVNNKGYAWIELRKNGERKHFLIHRLVAIHFLEKQDGKNIVNHIDENTLNNNVENLEWCDFKYNINYSQKLHPNRKRGLKKNIYKVEKLDKNGNVLEIFDSISYLVNLKGYNSWSISQCCNGKRKTAYGYQWRFSKQYSDLYKYARESV